MIPLERAEPVRADEGYLTASMMDPNAQIHRGYRPVMPSYFGVLPASEAAAIVAYIKSLRTVPRGPDVPAFGLTEPATPAPIPQLPVEPPDPTWSNGTEPIPPPGTE